MKIFLIFSFLSCFAQLSYAQVTQIPQIVLANPDEFSHELGDLSPVYAEILREFGHQYQLIGEREARRVLDRQNGFYLAGLNHVGFSFDKSFMHFDVNLQRQIAPDLFDDHRYIVTDTFNIIIDASKLLSRLSSNGQIQMSQSQLALFAGVVFRRTYRYTHFADTYEDGLVFDLNKMFLNFQFLQNRKYLELSPYEIVQREDYLSAAVGGVAMVPITTGVAASIGAMAKWHQLHKMEVQALGPLDLLNSQNKNEAIRLSFEKSRLVQVMGALGVHAEFLRFLRVTLLSYDFTYSLEESQKTYLSFDKRDVEELRQDEAGIGQQVKNLLRGRMNIDYDLIAPYIVSHEQRILERKTSRYMVLLLGGFKDLKTEQIRVVQGERITNFFRHHFEKVKFIENFFSRLIANLLKAHLQLEAIVNHSQSETKKMRIEYQSTRNLLDLKQNLPKEAIQNESSLLSLHFDREFKAEKLNKMSRDRLLKLLSHFSGVDPLIDLRLKNDGFFGPLNLKSQFVVDRRGVEYLNQIDPRRVPDMVKGLCNAHSVTLWDKFRNLFGGCKNKLNKAYDLYYAEFHHRPITSSQVSLCQSRSRLYSNLRQRQAMLQKCMEIESSKSASELGDIPLWRLRDFADALHEETDNKIDLLHFFGLSTVFLHGSFQAQTDFGPFQSFFNEGKFRSLGAVDEFKRKEALGSRAPASVIVE